MNTILTHFKAGMAFAIPALWASLSCDSAAQPDTLWTRAIDNASWRLQVIRTADGGFAVGTSGWAGDNEHHDGDFQIIKTDSLGRLEWRHFYRGLIDDDGYTIVQLPDGGYILGGGSADATLIRTDSEGDTLWMHYYSDEELDSPTGAMNCQIAPDGNIYVVSIHSAAKVDIEDGEIIWNILLEETLVTCLVNRDGGFLGVGCSGWCDNIFAIKFDSNGDVEWQQEYEADEGEVCGGVVAALNGGWFLVGSSRFGNRPGDVYPVIARIDENGHLLWRHIVSEFGRDKRFMDVVATDDGGFTACGYGTDYYFLVRFDYFGEPVWRTFYGNWAWPAMRINGEAYSVLRMDDGGYLLGGFSWDVDCYLVRTEPDTVVLSFELTALRDSLDFGGVHLDSTACLEISLHNPGRRYVVIDSVALEGDTANFSLSIDLPLCIYPPDTAYIPIAFLPTDTTFYSSRLTFYFGEEQMVEVNLSGRGIASNTVPLEPGLRPFVLSLSATPNPFNQLVQICYTLPVESDIRLAIYDLNGRLIEQLAGERKDAGRYTVNWTAKGIASGLYILRLESGKEVRNQKLMLIR